MNVEKYIKENVSRIVANGARAFISPDIPEKKLNGAIAAIATGVDPNYVVAIIDTSLFGNGKDGCVFVGDRIYFKNPDKDEIPFISLSSIEKRERTEKDKNGNDLAKTDVFIKYKDGLEKDITENLSYLNKDEFVAIISQIIQSADESENAFESTNQLCPLSMMDSKIKEAYIKIICNYAFSDDSVIDASEYAEIMSLIVINSIDKDSRLNLRSYMSDDAILVDNEVLQAYLFDNIDAGSLDVVKYSIMKDTINLYWKKEKNDKWKQNRYIVQLQKDLDIQDDKVTYMLENIIENEKILTERKSDIEIKRSMQDLVAKAGAVGVPLAAIYLSGSVIGISAAGMTSGLAALGMGGVLGFSSMFTGIGVVVLLGVGAYKGIKKVTGMGDLEKNKQRELMLQQIAKNSQRALNLLIEDVNEMTRQLQDAIQQGAENEIKIKKISAMLSMLMKGAQNTASQITYAESEQVLCSLPQKIDIGRLEELTQGATKQRVRTFVLSAYSVNKENDNGEIEEYCLNTELTLENLEALYAALDDIGYLNMLDASVASVKSTAKNLIKGLIG